MQKIKYNTGLYPFLETIQCALVANDLENLHKVDFNSGQLITREKDQSTPFHALYYTNNEIFLSLYRKFIHEVIAPIFGEQIVYQTVPTFRVQYPNNKGVGEFHRDGDYNHNPEEINFFLPFTDAKETSAIWIETEKYKEDYFPMNAEYGEAIQFNGVSLKHGNKINETGNTRVSVDFRVIPLSKYKEENGKSSINTKLEFKIGGYYSLSEKLP
jgi:ectoine hydroxylase-related dioxygenase (phytanoyl-CoA dioxygenase family)